MLNKRISWGTTISEKQSIQRTTKIL